MERGSPVTVAGAARDLSPASLGALALAGPASRAIRDVAAEINTRGQALSSFGTPPFAADASATGSAATRRARHDRPRFLLRTSPERLLRAAARAAPGRSARRRRKRHAGRRLAVLAAAIAVPAMAAPVEWAPAAVAAPAEAAAPMAFETPGESFPGSAFYYLDDLPNLHESGRSRAGGRGGTSPSAPVRRPARSRPGRARAARSPAALTDRARAQQCLTLAIYYEAASEPDAGQRAVAQVVLNRVAHPAYPEHRVRRGVPGLGAAHRVPVQLHLRRLAGAPAGADVVGPRRRGRPRGARRRGLRAGRPRDALPHRADPPVLGRQPRHTSARSARTASTAGAAPPGRSLAFSDAYRGGEPVAAPLAAARPTRLRPRPIRWRWPAPTRQRIAERAASRRPPSRPAPAYAAEIEARGGDALFRANAAARRRPGARGIRPQRPVAASSREQPELRRTGAGGTSMVNRRQHCGNHAAKPSLSRAALGPPGATPTPELRHDHSLRRPAPRPGAAPQPARDRQGCGLPANDNGGDRAERRDAPRRAAPFRRAWPRRRAPRAQAGRGRVLRRRPRRATSGGSRSAARSTGAWPASWRAGTGGIALKPGVEQRLRAA